MGSLLTELGILHSSRLDLGNWAPKQNGILDKHKAGNPAGSRWMKKHHKFEGREQGIAGRILKSLLLLSFQH